MPGFGHLNKSRQILENIADWFEYTYRLNLCDVTQPYSRVKNNRGSPSHDIVPRISGVVYLHSIGDTELKQNTLDFNHEMLQRICGELFYDKVILVTSGNDQEERHLRNSQPLGTMIALDTKVDRFTGTEESAISLINEAIDAPRSNQTKLNAHQPIMLLQREILLEGKTLRETRSGKYLHGALKTCVDREGCEPEAAQACFGGHFW